MGTEHPVRTDEGGGARRLYLFAIGILVLVPVLFIAWSALGIREVGPIDPVLAARMALGESLPRWAQDLMMLSSLLLATGAALVLRRRGAMAQALRTAERSLEESKARLHPVLDQMPAVLWSTDRDLRFVTSQGAGLRDLGLVPGKVVGSTLYEYFGTDDPAFPPIAAHLRALDGVPNSYETLWGGEHFQTWVEPLRDGRTGGIEGVVGVALNVTEERHAQEALRQSEEALRQAQKMEAVGRLASGVAHDFNNLLTAITGYSEMGLASLRDEETIARCLREIGQASARATGLTRQLLLFSRKQVLDPEVLELNEMVDEAKDLLQRVIGEDIELITKLGPEAGCVRVDRSQIVQVILNLAVNARDAMPGGGKLLIETGRTELGEPYASRHLGVCPGVYALLAVSDTGIGMDRATQERLFEPFFTTKGPDKGTGLGLATVYGIVKQNGGNIWVYSEPAQGATFKIYLPLAGRAVAEESAVAAAGPEAAEGSERILLVEDDPSVRSLLVEGLRLNGYSVIEARDGEEGLRLCSSGARSIDLLVTDVVMPQMSGREMVRKLSAAGVGTRVLFMSGYTESAILEHGLLEPDTHFIQKPFTPARLSKKIREILDAPVAELV